MYNTTTLKNGLRIIHLPSPSPIIYCGYEIAAGTRDEAPGQEGLAHFCEHMSFKGTESRTSMQIINCIEGVGGELNAFTSKDTTAFYVAIQKEHLVKAVRLLTDIVFRSVYPQGELQKEVEVVCDEIESFNDSPAELIYDEFENIIFRDHPLGHSILGTQDNVRAFSTGNIRAFTGRFYVPDNAIFFCYGDIDFSTLCTMLQKEKLTSIAYEQSSDLQKTPVSPTENADSNEIIKELGTHQAHVMIGRKAYSIHDEHRLALYLLNNIIGGPGMNARLNLSLRERYGLVYIVESTMASYSDTGLWSIYFGCDHDDVKRCRQLVRKELDRLMQRPLSQKRLAAAKRQLKGQIALACDNRESFALDFAKSFLHYDWEKDIDALCRDIDALTAEQLYVVAQEMFAPETLTTLIYT